MKKEGIFEEIEIERKDKEKSDKDLHQKENEFTPESIIAHYESNPELKGKYISEIKEHQFENETILEVVVKNDGLKQSSIPTKEQYEVLNYLTAGEYPNAKNISHVAKVLVKPKESPNLDEQVKMSHEGRLDYKGDLFSFKNSDYFCSPWNSWFSSEDKINFVFRPEDLMDFLSKITEDIFGLKIEQLMDEAIKDLLNNLDEGGVHVFSYDLGEFDNRPFEKRYRLSEKQLGFLNSILPKYKVEPMFVEEFVGALKKRIKKIKTAKLERLSEPDRQGLFNLIFYAARAYFEIVYNKEKHLNELKEMIEEIVKNPDPEFVLENKEKYKNQLKKGENNYVEFLSKKEFEKLKKERKNIEKRDWAYVSVSGWGDYGFVTFSSFGKNELTLSDASVVLANGRIKSEKLNIQEDDKQRVFFRFKKNKS